MPWQGLGNYPSEANGQDHSLGRVKVFTTLHVTNGHFLSFSEPLEFLIYKPEMNQTTSHICDGGNTREWV